MQSLSITKPANSNRHWIGGLRSATISSSARCCLISIGIDRHGSDIVMKRTFVAIFNPCESALPNDCQDLSTAREALLTLCAVRNVTTISIFSDESYQREAMIATDHSFYAPGGSAFSSRAFTELLGDSKTIKHLIL